MWRLQNELPPVCFKLPHGDTENLAATRSLVFCTDLHNKFTILIVLLCPSSSELAMKSIGMARCYCILPGEEMNKMYWEWEAVCTLKTKPNCLTFYVITHIFVQIFWPQHKPSGKENRSNRISAKGQWLDFTLQKFSFVKSIICENQGLNMKVIAQPLFAHRFPVFH